MLAVNLDDTSINADRVIQEDRVMQGNDNRLLGNVDYDEEEDDEYSGGGGGWKLYDQNLNINSLLIIHFQVFKL